MKKNVLSVAICGLGRIGKLHLETVNSMEGMKVVALIDNSLISSDLPVFSSVQECNSVNPEIDMYVIASPNGLHYMQAKEVLDLGKNVLVEKPVCLRKKEVEELIEKADSSNLRFFTCVQLRFSPVVKYVKNLLNKHLLGRIFLVNVECYWNRNSQYYENSTWHGTQQIDGGVLYTQFSHFIDILHYLLGSLKIVKNQTANFTHKGCTEFPDSGIIQFLSGETLGSMIYTISTYEKKFESSITLIAERGTIKIGGQYLNQLLYQNVHQVKSATFTDQGKEFHKFLYQDIQRAIRKNTSSIVDARHAVNVIDFIEKASNSLTF